jgi:hypothetical protein
VTPRQCSPISTSLGTGQINRQARLPRRCRITPLCQAQTMGSDPWGAGRHEKLLPREQPTGKQKISQERGIQIAYKYGRLAHRVAFGFFAAISCSHLHVVPRQHPGSDEVAIWPMPLPGHILCSLLSAPTDVKLRLTSDPDRPYVVSLWVRPTPGSPWSTGEWVTYPLPGPTHRL